MRQRLLARRSFLRRAGVLPFLGGLPLASSADGADAALGPRIRLSCNFYSFNEPFTKGTLTLFEALDFCAELGFDAVDPTGYYFPGYPEAPPDPLLYDFKRRAGRLGLDISGTGVRTDFTAADRAKREADVVLAKRWVDVAVKLGAPMVRVFAGRGVPEGGTEAETTAGVVDCLKACAEYGASRGVLIVLQHHDDLLKTAEQTLAMVDRVGSDWLRLTVDIGSLRTTGDPYAEIARLAPLASTWQIKEQVYRKGVAEDVDVAAIVRILRESKYRGYIPLETLGAGDPRPKLRVFTERVRQALA
jgi:sugar phosphate isomerase/epimerase